MFGDESFMYLNRKKYSSLIFRSVHVMLIFSHIVSCDNLKLSHYAMCYFEIVTRCHLMIRDKHVVSCDNVILSHGVM